MESNGKYRFFPYTSSYSTTSVHVTIYESILRPHMDYDDVIYDQPSNDSFSKKKLNQSNFQLVIYSIYRNYKTYLSREVVPRTRTWVSSSEKMNETFVSVLHNTSKTLLFLPFLLNRTNTILKSEILVLNVYFIILSLN